MSETKSLLDFDSSPTAEVRIGGRAFCIRQQCAGDVQKVLELSGMDADRQIKGDGDQTEAIRSMFANWPDQIRATCLMLGVAEDDTAAIGHLKEHLAPTHVMQIWRKWWEVNDITAFFSRGGRALMLESVHQEIEMLRRRLVEAEVQKLLSEVEAPTAAEPAPEVVN